MLQLQNFSFYGWLCLSVLAHFALAALILQQQLQLPQPRFAPAPIEVFVAHNTKVASQHQPQIAQPAPAAKPMTPSVTAKTLTTQSKKPATARVTKTMVKPSDPQPAKETHQSAAASTVVAANRSNKVADIAAILSAAGAKAAQRELSATELAALSTSRTQAPAANSGDIRRLGRKPGSDPASDVLEQLPDGSHLVKVGKDCVLAAPGADLRKDIHSMKVVACGAGGRTEQDRIDAHFEQVMSGIGRHR